MTLSGFGFMSVYARSQVFFLHVLMSNFVGRERALKGFSDQFIIMYASSDSKHGRNLAQQKQTRWILQTFKLARLEQNLKLSQRDYTVGISLCGKAKLWQDACQLIEQMTETRVSPNVFSCSAAISACEKGGQWEQALVLFQAMPKAKISPNVISYSAAISACEKGGQ